MTIIETGTKVISHPVYGSRPAVVTYGNVPEQGKVPVGMKFIEIRFTPSRKGRGKVDEMTVEADELTFA
jgi:hypothetical protein